MISTKLLVAAVAAAVLVPASWQQTSPIGYQNKIGFAVNQVPAATDVWTWSSADSQQIVRSPIPITGVSPNQSPARFATISDIDVSVFGINNTFDAAKWWIRDGSTGQVLYSSSFVSGHGPNNNAGHSSVHLTTPIVLDRGSSNPPTLEFGSDGWVPAQSPLQYTCSIVGRYVWPN